MNANLEKWHDVIFNQDKAKLSQILADDVIFHSPVVHTPQKGKQITFMYLSAAFIVLFNDTFKYVREVTNETETLLEFEVEIDGILINGIDMISWNNDPIVEVIIVIGSTANPVIDVKMFCMQKLKFSSV